MILIAGLSCIPVCFAESPLFNYSCSLCCKLPGISQHHFCDIIPSIVLVIDFVSFDIVREKMLDTIFIF